MLSIREIASSKVPALSYLILSSDGPKLGITCSTHLKGGVALTGTQKSEYWTMPHICSLQPGILRFALLLPSHKNTHVADFLPALSILCSTPNPRPAFVTAPPVQGSSSAERGPESLTCTTIPDGGTCEDAALFWSFRDHQHESNPPPTLNARISLRRIHRG
jgi:hypothetical protein